LGVTWATAIANFADCLPSGIARWVLLCDRGYQLALARVLSRKLPIAESIVLGGDAPQRVRAIAARHVDNAEVGLLEFICFDGARLRGGRNYRHAMEPFALWQPERVRLCFDVTDANFRELFSEAPRLVKARGQRLRRRLAGEEQLALTAGTTRATLRCRAGGWDVHSGLERDDYILPSGEIECVPESVDGDVEVNGWIVGTILFGTKYGRIGPAQLRLRFRGGEVAGVAGNHRRLCEELDTAFTTLPGLRRVAELGIGQSKAVARAAQREQVGCLWHERHRGVHLGLGASLHEPTGRATQHHLDVVLATGSLTGAGGRAILRW
jgi:hypothetical protein